LKFGPVSVTTPREGRGTELPRPCGPILVVEDDEETRRLIADVLAHLGYEVNALATGEEALEVAAMGRPAAVILDVCLPGMSGYHVCQRLRAEFGGNLPILFMSASRTQSFDRASGFLVGGDDYLIKPFALDEFVARLRRHLERSAGRLESPLTRRELEILELLAQGFAQKEIAKRLFISRKTVGSHTERIFSKLGAHNRVQAVFAAQERGLLDEPTVRAHGNGSAAPARISSS
jgi:DNA-binding NarL/FixJ family response regulator